MEPFRKFLLQNAKKMTTAPQTWSDPCTNIEGIGTRYEFITFCLLEVGSKLAQFLILESYIFAMPSNVYKLCI